MNKYYKFFISIYYQKNEKPLIINKYKVEYRFEIHIFNIKSLFNNRIINEH